MTRPFPSAFRTPPTCRVWTARGSPGRIDASRRARRLGGGNETLTGSTLPGQALVRGLSEDRRVRLAAVLCLLLALLAPTACGASQRAEPALQARRRAHGQGPRTADRLRAARSSAGRGTTSTTTAATPATTSCAATSPHRLRPGHARLRRGRRHPARPVHRQRPIDLRPRRRAARRADRPRGGARRRLAEGRAALDRATADRARQRPAEPARRRRPGEPPEGRRRHRDLAAAEQGVPLRATSRARWRSSAATACGSPPPSRTRCGGCCSAARSSRCRPASQAVVDGLAAGLHAPGRACSRRAARPTPPRRRAARSRR